MHGSQRSLVATNSNKAGLGNRMRFTLSALSLAEAHGRGFSYAWPQSKLFKPALTELWEFDHPRISWSDAAELSKEVPYTVKSKDLPEDAGTQPVWHFRSPHALALPEGATPWTERLRGLKPVKEIQDRATTLHGEHLRGAPYVGVMVRAHAKSHVKTLEASPVEWYLERMSELDAAYPGINFFLSCDVPEVQERIIKAFPNSVGQNDKGGYNSVEGVVAGVTDLYLLAASSYMIVPYWSSFPTMAWELADRKIVREHSRAGRQDVNIAEVPMASNPLRPADRS